MSDGSGNRNARFAFKNVERSGAEVAFLANEFAFAETALHDGAAVHLKESSRDAVKNGNLQQVFGFETLRSGTFGNRCAGDALVGEGAGWTRDHAFAARDTGGIAHGRVQIEGDGRGITLSLSRDNIIVTDLSASAHAAVAKDASRVVHQNAE